MKYFPQEFFLIHVKSNDPEEGKELAKYFSQFSKERLKNITVYGGTSPLIR
jgi:glycerophosphoryl diester phosphodiesterase